ncbi:MAG: N-acetylmuramoyl-L-alanine amidase CwlD [Clostridia bacterium]|nr:N-acetylmuramoyl-L-alanine amidase CwlD [Clostridia bacterium]
MIVVLKRSNLFILALSVFLSAVTVNMVDRADIVPANAVPVSDKVIVLDAGHGASDGGAVSSSGVTEKDINLKIALRLQKLLEQTGATVIVTRADDNAIAQSKRSDMRLRKNIKENSAADIFVSIHMNKFSQSKYSGAQVFYSPDEKSKVLGEAIQTSMREILNPDNNREAKSAGDSIYILKKSDVPSVIVECGFLSNPEEERLLTQSDYQDKVAWSVYAGITSYFDNE